MTEGERGRNMSHKNDPAKAREQTAIRKLLAILRRGDRDAVHAVTVVLNHHFFRMERIHRESKAGTMERKGLAGETSVF